MKKFNIIKGTIGTLFIGLWAIVTVSIFLFAFTFLVGSVEISVPEKATCSKIDLNIERLWPVRAACWFWKPVTE